MSRTEESDFQQVDSGAEPTRPVQCSTLRKNGYVVLHKDHPCKIMDTMTSKPGKHGSSKVHLIGLDLFTGRRYEAICQSGHRILVPLVSRAEREVSFFSGETAYLFNDDMTIRGDLSIGPNCHVTKEEADAMVMEAEADTEGRKRVVATVLKAMGREMIKTVKIHRE